MTKKVLISLEQLDRLIMDIIGDGIVGIKKLYYDDKQAKKWFDAQEDLEPTLNAIDDMDLWDDIEYYISETEDEESID